MRDIMSKNDPLNEFRPFGGLTIVLGSDFRQILPVAEKDRGRILLMHQ